MLKGITTPCEKDIIVTDYEYQKCIITNVNKCQKRYSYHRLVSVKMVLLPLLINAEKVYLSQPMSIKRYNYLMW